MIFVQTITMKAELKSSIHKDKGHHSKISKTKRKEMIFSTKSKEMWGLTKSSRKSRKKSI